MCTISLIDEVKEVLGNRSVVTADDLEKLTYMEQVRNLYMHAISK